MSRFAAHHAVMAVIVAGAICVPAVARHLAPPNSRDVPSIDRAARRLSVANSYGEARIFHIVAVDPATKKAVDLWTNINDFTLRAGAQREVIIAAPSGPTPWDILVCTQAKDGGGPSVCAPA